MYILYVLTALEALPIEHLLSLVCATDRHHISPVSSDEERSDVTLTYATTELAQEAWEAGIEPVVFALELSVFGAREPAVSTLDFAWQFHQQANSAVSICARSIWIDEYIVLQDNECYLAHDISFDALAFNPLHYIKSVALYKIRPREIVPLLGR